jgi:hypothetical protein
MEMGAVVIVGYAFLQVGVDSALWPILVTAGACMVLFLTLNVIAAVGGGWMGFATGKMIRYILGCAHR